jgi:hypothetical protein
MVFERCVDNEQVSVCLSHFFLNLLGEVSLNQASHAWSSIPDSVNPVHHEITGHTSFFLAPEVQACWQRLFRHKIMYGGENN